MRWYAWRQLESEGDTRATRPDHHLSGQLLQRLRVFRRLRITGREVQLLELLPRAELPGAEQRDEVVELAQVVLKGSRREEQEVIAVDLLQEPVRRGAVILDLVGFVDDHEVPAVAKDLLGVACTAGAIVGRDRFDGVLPLVRIRRRGEALEELALQLSLPLHHERGGREDEHPAREAAYEQLLEDDPRLDGLAESDLVGEDCASAHLPKDASRDLDLVGELLDGVGVERDETVEAGRERDPLGLASKLCPDERAWRLLQSARELGERALIDGPEIVCGCCGNGHRRGSPSKAEEACLDWTIGGPSRCAEGHRSLW